jgi:peptidoglycan/xylan/chitin deacetylase (PgdA/CDA1 family)
MLSRWLRSPLTKFSFALHVGALAGIAVYPAGWLWALAIVAANHAVLTIVGMWPRSTLLGPNWIRLPAAAIARGEIAITIDDGPDPEVTPRVLDILDAHNAVASFFCIGEQAIRHPELCREIVRRGHAIENHGQNHLRHFAFLGPWRMKAEVQAAQDTLTRITGIKPLFFRATAGLRTPFLDPILAGLDLHLATWTRRAFDTRNGNADQVADKLLTKLGGGDILLLHDGNAAHAPSGEAVILEVLPRVLDAVKCAGLRAVTLRSALCDNPRHASSH